MYKMKQYKFWSIGTLCVLLACMVLHTASCSKEDEPVSSKIKVVVDEGADTKVTTKMLPGSSGTESAGTEISYKSWIQLQKDVSGGRSSAPARGPMLASSKDDVETISVLLRDVFHNLDTAIVVDSFDFGQPTSTITYSTNGQRREGYVTITDSVMYYNVNFDGFSFRYLIEYEVAVYDDGYNRIIMPYHKIKNIRDNGFSVEDLEFVLEPNSSGGKDVYLRKKIKHSITVEFNGADYTLHGNVVLKKRIGTHPCMISSELIDKGISDIDNRPMHTIYTSWAKVKYLLSDNSSDTKTYSINMHGYVEYKSTNIESFLPTSDIALISTSIDSVGDNSAEWDNYKVTERAKKLTITYNMFSTVAILKEAYAHYDDGILQFDFPNITYSDVEVDYGVSEFGQSDSYINYWFREEVRCKFGDAWHRFTYSYPFNVHK